MIRGLYTGAAGMLADQERMNVIANNLANVDTTGYKQDVAVYKSFPEMLLRRTNDNGLNVVPAGSWDEMPIVGKLGTGVELNEVFTKHNQGAFHQTENPLDLAIKGQGFMTILTPKGERYTRDGSFFINKEGYVVNKEGFKLLGEKGPVQLQHFNFKITPEGKIIVNEAVRTPLTSNKDNLWENPTVIDQLKIRTFRFMRELKKEGVNNYLETPHSGPAIPVEESFEIHQGFLEKSNVSVVREMVQMIEVQRHYEANQKSMQNADTLLGKLINDVSR